MNRRDTLLALAALSAPLRAFAQDGKVRRIGFLIQGRRDASPVEDRLRGAFLKSMGELGYTEGKNLAIEWRFDDNRSDRLPVLAAELAALRPEIIVAHTTAATRAAQKATSTIPIVMVTVTDPIGSGFVKSLARPDSNITGSANFAGDVGRKQLGLLLEIVPKAATVAVLWNPDNLGSAPVLRSIQETAQKLGKKTIPVEARMPKDIAPAFAKMAKEKADALIFIADPFLNLQPIAELAIKQRLPSMGSLRGHAEGGCLASYGSDRAENYARAAHYVDKLLRGAKPGDLPVEQPTKFEFFINRRTAKALGLTIAPALLARADEVIE